MEARPSRRLKPDALLFIITYFSLREKVGADEHMGRVLEVPRRAQNVGEKAQHEAVDGQHALQGVRRVLRAREQAQLPDVHIQLTPRKGAKQWMGWGLVRVALCCRT